MNPAGPLLLDTHVVVWWLLDRPQLTEATREAIATCQAAHISSASTWEVSIKRSLGKLEVNLPAATDFPQACRGQGFALVDVTHADAEAVASLPAARRDPFDRLLAATARRRGWTLVTRDPGFAALDVPTLWRP